ncbi:MAG: SpoIVB peptidase S55 domain-containing protein [Vicinamibacterales bacterium]
MPIDEVRPGMLGVGYTVFEGTKVEEFKAHIVGVLRNAAGPKRDLIIARLEGGPLAETGVIAGMSGSPVFIDGRLVGAVGYSLGTFSKEPIAGITPIEEMIEATSVGEARSARGSKLRLELPLTPENMRKALASAFASPGPFAQNPGDVLLLAGEPGFAMAGSMATMLRPIATPLVMGGFHPSIAGTVAGVFGAYGFLPQSSGSMPGNPAVQAGTGLRLRPGDPVGVSLVSGDLVLGATGTVTEVDGDRVYAFGHPFYNLGPTAYPMTRAYVHALLPSFASSMKIASTGEVIGTFRQDRATAIAGTLGEKPVMVPVKLTLHTDRGLTKSFSFDVVDDQLFTPLLTYVSIINTLTSYERENGAVTFTVKGKARVREHGDLTFEDIFTGDMPSVGAASYVVAPITFLLTNDFAPVAIEGVDIEITTSERPQTAKLERVWLDAVRPRAGQNVPLKVLLRTYRGEEIVRTVPLSIPPNASGRLSVLVSDGSQLAQWEQREVRQPLEARGIAHMIRTFNKIPKHSHLYVRLLSQDAGGVVGGEYLPSLPPSVLAVFEADRNGGNFIPLRNATLGEWEIQVGHAVSGSRLLAIDVDPQ